MSSHQAVQKLRRLAASYPGMLTGSGLHGCLMAAGLTVEGGDALPQALLAGVGLAAGEQPTAAIRQTLTAGLEALDDEFVEDRLQAYLGTPDDEPGKSLAAWCEGFLRVVEAEAAIWRPWEGESGYVHNTLDTLRGIAAGNVACGHLAASGERAAFDRLIDGLAQEINDLRLMAGVEAPPLPGYEPAEVASWDVEDVIARLEADGELAPWVLVDDLARRGPAVIPMITDVLTRDASWEADDVLPLHLVFALGWMTTAEADPPLLIALEAIEAFPEWPWWDVLRGGWPRIWRAPGSAALKTCAEMVADSGRDWLMRTEALSLLAAAERHRGGTRLESLIDAVAARFEDDGEAEAFRVSCLHFLLDFPRARHRALLEREICDEPGTEVVREFVADDIANAFEVGDAPEWEQLDEPAEFYSDDALRQRRREMVLEALDSEAAAHQPRLRGGPKIGRNDPCPCGSGLKYKKCCLESGAPGPPR